MIYQLSISVNWKKKERNPHHSFPELKVIQTASIVQNPKDLVFTFINNKEKQPILNLRRWNQEMFYLKMTETINLSLTR